MADQSLRRRFQLELSVLLDQSIGNILGRLVPHVQFSTLGLLLLSHTRTGADFELS